MALALKKKSSSEGKPEKPARAEKPARPDKPSRKKSGGGKSGGTSKRFSLLVGDEGGILVYMEGNKVVRRLFSPSAMPPNTEAMVSLMTAHPTVPITILLDVLDQQFVRQTFPPVSPLSVGGLVKRRLDRDFQTDDLKGSLALGRDKTGRKEWQYLLIAIAKTALLTSWLDLIGELPNPLLGIYLTPVEATLYLDMIAKAGMRKDKERGEWQLLVTHNKVSGFRQVVVHKGKLVFTRVTQAIDDAIPAVIAGNIEQEIINTIEYLRRLNFQDESGLDITVIAAQEVKEVLDLKRFTMGVSETLTPLEVSDMLGLEQAALSADRFGDVVMASAFIRSKKHALRFSTAYIDTLAKLYKARVGVKIACALISLLFLGLAGDNVMTIMSNNSDAEHSQTQQRAVSEKLSDLKKSIAGLNKNLAFKSAVVSAHDVFFKNVPIIDNFINELSVLLTRDERVISIDWVSPLKDSNTTAAAGTAAKEAPPLKVTVQFDFRGAYADMEALSRSETAFLAMLAAKMPRYTITHETFPWQKGAQKDLEISFDQTQDMTIKDGDTHLTVNFVAKKLDAKGNPIAPAPGTPGATP